ncbi:MAG TPA: nitroreductase family protein [Methanocella sp.]|nr:nitroreductase family protein [Methanocella sp.]
MMGQISTACKLPTGDSPSEKYSNAVLQSIYSRRSVRNYKPDLVPDEILLEVIKAGIYAPTAANQQVWRFSVITDKSVIDRYSERAKKLWLKFIPLRMAALLGIGGGKVARIVKMMQTSDLHIFHHAPALVFIFAPKGITVELDCAAATQNMLLAAQSLGVGSCWIGFAMPLGNDKKTRAELKIPKGYKPIAAMVFGYPVNEARKAPTRNEDVLLGWT